MWNRWRDAHAVPDPGARRLGGGAALALAVSLGSVLLGAGAASAATAGAAATATATLAEEPPIAGEGIEGDYLRALHERIHPLWAGVYVHGVADKLPAGSPAADRSRQAAVLFSIRWDGTPAYVTLVGESGVAPFDQAARDAILRVDHFPVPPVALFSDDGLVHLRWVLARDERLCSGGQLHRFEAPLEEAVPHLLIQGRVEEALWRVARHVAQALPGVPVSINREDPLAFFARAWLGRPQPDPISEGRAAAALARLGDDRQIPRLRVALQRRDTVAEAATALRALKIEVCPLVEASLGAADPSVREIGILALRAAGGRLPPTSPCVQALGAMVLDQKADGSQRALAARALAAIADDGARRLLSSQLTDADPAVRAAALSLLARPGGGRPILYRWVPFLHDPAIEVRAAAAAALLRSCGDLALDQLVLVWKEPDPRVAVAVANELGRMSSPASEAFLIRLTKRRDPEVRAATTAALAARRELASGPRTMARSAKTSVASVVASGPAGTPVPVTNNAAVRAISGMGRREAAEWILSHFNRLDHADLIEVFGTWLAGPAPVEPGPVSSR